MSLAGPVVQFLTVSWLLSTGINGRSGRRRASADDNAASHHDSVAGDGV